MNVRSFKKLATVSALALGAVMSAGGSHAAPIQSGTATAVPIGATILNTFAVTSTDLNFGKLAFTPKAGSQALATLGPAAVITTGDTGGGVPANPRIIVDSTVPATPAVINVTGFASTQVKVDYTNCVNLINGASVITLFELDDNLLTPTTGTGGANGKGCNGPTQGNAVTTVAGLLVFNVGAKIKTALTAVPYPDGAYTGHFDITLSY